MTRSNAPMPVVRTARLQNVTNVSTVLGGVLRNQNLSLPDRDNGLAAPFSFSEATEARWRGTFGLTKTDPGVPFFFHTRPGAKLLHAHLKQLGINFKNILHLHTEFELVGEGDAGLQPNHLYHLHMQLDDVALLRKDRAVAILNAMVEDNGTPIIQIRDSYCINRLHQRDRRKLEQNANYNRTEVAHLVGLSRRLPQLDPARNPVQTIRIPSDMGVTYGKVSGDLNIVHISNLFSRLFGHKRAFIQGYCTVQCMLKALRVDHGLDVRKLAVTFCRPVYVGQDVRLVIGPQSCELIDPDGNLLTVGEYA